MDEWIAENIKAAEKKDTNTDRRKDRQAGRKTDRNTGLGLGLGLVYSELERSTIYIKAERHMCDWDAGLIFLLLTSIPVGRLCVSKSIFPGRAISRQEGQIQNKQT